MTKWYVFEYDNRNDVEVFDSLKDARLSLDAKHLERVTDGVYKKNRYYVGTKKGLKNSGFENVRFVRN